MRAVEEEAPAKLNLCLRVTGRRADGYHELDSWVVFIEWADRLSLVPDEALRLELTGPFAAALAGQPDNLAIRAVRRLAAHVGRPPKLRLILDKRIPVAAGLGGGSADAAATLRGLDRLWDLRLESSELLAIALELGADVPVCLLGRPARVRGIGERLEPLAVPAPIWCWPTRARRCRPDGSSPVSIPSDSGPPRKRRRRPIAPECSSGCGDARTTSRPRRGASRRRSIGCSRRSGSSRVAALPA
jgi:4-diphosphocytidyl-2C-methyl-D-erythritol kinase